VTHITDSRLKEAHIAHMNAQTGQEVLIVDNDEDDLLALDGELKELGHAPMTTWSGIEALSLLQSRRFDVLLVDSYLPDMYIGDFLERVSQLPARPKIWVMQAKPTQDTCIYESQCFSVVGKRQVAQIFERLGTDMNGNISEPSA